MAKRNGILIFLKELFFPPKCPACHTLLPWAPPQKEGELPFSLCAQCLKKWENEKLETCGICAKKVTECTCMPKPMQHTGCLGLCKLVYYTSHQSEPVQNRLIYHMKHLPTKRATQFLASALSAPVEAFLREQATAPSQVVLTYLPRSTRAKLRYGADQAYVLAKELSRRCGIPLRRLILRSRNGNKEQKQLSPYYRIQNAKRAFLANPREDCRGKTVLLLDDLVTTGASMSVGVRVLKNMGAEKVLCIAIATDISNKDAKFF